MDRGAWLAIVHGVAKSQTRLSDLNHSLKIELIFKFPQACLVAQLVKNPPAVWETWVRSLGWEESLEKGKATAPVFWPGGFHGLCRPRGRKESEMTEQLSLHSKYSMQNSFHTKVLINPYLNVCVCVFSHSVVPISL